MSGNDGGYLEWTDPYFDPDVVYIDGEEFSTGIQKISKRPAESTLFHFKSHANTSILQRLYFGSAAPQRMDSVVFELEFQVFLQSLKRKLSSLGKKKSAFYLCPFDREIDVFDATSGSSYKLMRPLASSVISGVTSVTHPTVFILDGAEDPSAASVTGQTVTANSTGVLEVHYTPIYRCIVLGDWSEAVNEVNEIICQATIEEVVSV